MLSDSQQGDQHIIIPQIVTQRSDLDALAAIGNLRLRSSTLDSFSINSIESRRDVAAREEYQGENLESATWIFSDLLLGISAREKSDVALIVSKSNQLVDLLQANPTLKQEIVIQHVMSKIQFMLYDQAPQLRCAAYRILRHSAADQETLQFLVQLKLLIFIIVSFSTLTPYLEKEEALKLVRHFLDIPNGANFLSIGVIKALVALVEHENEETQEGQDEPPSTEYHVPPAFTRLCIETICELSILKPDIVFHGGGLRLLISLIINASSDIAASCIMALMTCLDKPEARLFLRNGYDLDSLISVYSLFEENDEGKAPNTKKYYNRALKISFLLTVLLKTWTGIICFSHNKFDSLKVLLSNLRKKNNKLRSMILDLLLDVLRIKALPWLEHSSIGEVMAKFMVQVTNNPNHQVHYDYSILDPQSFEYSITSHFQGLMSKVLFNCDVFSLLFDIIRENRDEETTLKATFLLTNFVRLSVNLLPREFYNTHIFEALVGPLTLDSISTIELATKLQSFSSKIIKNGVVKSIVKEITIESRYYVDDATFKSMVFNTRVLTVKEFDEWNWNFVSQLFLGPLRNPQRFSEVQEKYPKFLKTMLSFFRPFKYRFSNLPYHASAKFPKLKNPRKLITIGCQILESLLSFDDGCKFLSENKLMPQLAEIFAQVDPLSGILSTEPILSRKRLENSLSIGYVKFLGIFSSSQNGIKILEQWQFFQLTNNIIECSFDSEDNNHLIFNMFNSLDFTYDSPFTLLLSKALNVSNWKIKVFLIDNVLPNLLTNEATESLAIENLVALLYDETEAVVQMSIDTLYEFFIVNNRLDRIDTLIEFRPSIEVLSDCIGGQELLLNFCKTTEGFRYLHRNGFIELCFNESIAKLQLFEYLNLVEHSLEVLYYPYFARGSDNHGSHKPDLHHFFNYLLATEEGFNYFNSRRSFVDDAISKLRKICQRLHLIDSLETDLDTEDNLSLQTELDLTIQDEVFSPDDTTIYGMKPLLSGKKDNNSVFLEVQRSDSQRTRRDLASAGPHFENTEEEDEYQFRKLKQYLWVVGEIASANYGIQILDPVYSSNLRSDHVVETLYQLYTTSDNWQLRGLAFYQLGKIASTVEGIEMLDALQWVSIDCVTGNQSVSLAYPRAMQDDDFFDIEILNPYNDASYFSLYGHDEISVYGQIDLEDDIVIETYEELDAKVLALINYLSSVLKRIERKAVKELNRIKEEKQQVFENVNLFLKTIRLIDKGKFSYRTRIFIFRLFNTAKILENLTRRDRKNSAIRR